MKMGVLSDDKSAGPLRGVVAAEERSSVLHMRVLIMAIGGGLTPHLGVEHNVSTMTNVPPQLQTSTSSPCC